MFDTNVFDSILDGAVSIDEFRDLNLFATHVQLDELRAAQTKFLERAMALFAVFSEVAPKNVPTQSAVWDVSKWDQANWSDDDEVFQKMLARLKQLDTASGKKPRNSANQQRDILIAETAMKEGHMLVSGDANLRTVTIEFGGAAIDFAELRQRA